MHHLRRTVHTVYAVSVKRSWGKILLSLPPLSLSLSLSSYTVETDISHASSAAIAESKKVADQPMQYKWNVEKYK